MYSKIYFYILAFYHFCPKNFQDRHKSLRMREYDLEQDAQCSLSRIKFEQIKTINNIYLILSKKSIDEDLSIILLMCLMLILYIGMKVLSCEMSEILHDEDWHAVSDCFLWAVKVCSHMLDQSNIQKALQGIPCVNLSKNMQMIIMKNILKQLDIINPWSRLS